MEQGKKRRKRNTANIAQWVILSLVLFGYLVFILVSYSNDIKKIGYKNVDEKLWTHITQVGNTFMNEITYMEGIAETFATVSASNGGKTVTEENLEILKKLVADSDAVSGYLSDAEGQALYCSGKQADVSQQPGFTRAITKISQWSEIFIDTGSGVYVIAITVPVIEENAVTGVVSILYPVSHFENLVKKGEHDGKTRYMLLRKDGTITSCKGMAADVKGSSIFDILSPTSKSSQSDIDKFVRALQNGKKGSFWCMESGENRKLFYQPVNNGEWYIVESFTQNFINNQARRIYGNTKTMMIQIMSAVAVFFALVVVIISLNRMVYKKQNRELQNKAETDLLTGLLNKIATQKHIEEYLETDGQDSQAMLCVLDLDNFKKINDTLGHAFGDQVLSTLGTRVRSEFRGTDIFGRIGGDEFIVFLKDIRTDEIRCKEAERVAGLFENFKVGDYVKYSPTASIGAAMYPKDGKTFEELYKAADKGVYLAKKRGKNQLCFCDEEENPISKSV